MKCPKCGTTMSDHYCMKCGYLKGQGTSYQIKKDVSDQSELEKTLGITPEITHAVIDTLESGASVVGRVTQDSILLYENAPKGAQFHEAWHRVSQLLISDDKRKKLYNRYRKKNGVTLTDQQIDEIYAEDFRRF